jgi:flagellar basal-body rod protein FlgC
MGMYAALGISATGLSAERLRMDVVANNLANADSTLGPGKAYRRLEVTTTPAPGGSEFALPGAPVAGAEDMHGVQVSGIVEDPSPLRRVYAPGDPDADAKGYVTKPNVNSVTEMVDMVAATRAYQANVTAFDATKSMALDTLKVLK